MSETAEPINPLTAYLDRKPRGAGARLARAARIAKSTLSEIAKNLREPTLDQARRLHAATDGEIAFADWNQPACDGAGDGAGDRQSGALEGPVCSS